MKIDSIGDNDKAFIQHVLGQMQQSMEAIGAAVIFRQEDDTNHLAGTDVSTRLQMPAWPRSSG